jgi:hypothetical protein
MRHCNGPLQEFLNPESLVTLSANASLSACGDLPGDGEDVPLDDHRGAQGPAWGPHGQQQLTVDGRELSLDGSVRRPREGFTVRCG